MTNNSITSFIDPGEELNNDDAAWALTCAFLILTMQTGFAMLECGCVSSKNVSNIMVKNVVDVSVGGLSYWIFGYALSFGKPSTWFCGYGDFFFNVKTEVGLGSEYSKYFFQFSFATTATTIVSGAVAERMKLHAYMAFSFFNTVVYCIPASWVWNVKSELYSGGWLNNFGFFDFAGCCVVHLTGGVSALVAALMLGPRTMRFQEPDKFAMSSPVTAMTGMFMLWWAWLGFNCGSTFGVSGPLWKITALVAVTTLNGAIGGGVVGLFISMLTMRGKVSVDYVINSVLGGLVGITGIAPVTNPMEAMFIGAVGGTLAVLGLKLEHYLKIDDPVGAIPVHGLSALWGTLAIGLFGKNNSLDMLDGQEGLFHGGGAWLLLVQFVGAISIILWSGFITTIELFIIKKTIGLRMSEEEEILGADWIEHGIKSEKLTQRLQDALRQIDDGHWNDFVRKLHGEIGTGLNNTKSNPNSQHHRVFGVDSEDPPMINLRRASLKVGAIRENELNESKQAKPLAKFLKSATRNRIFSISGNPIHRSQLETEAANRYPNIPELNFNTPRNNSAIASKTSCFSNSLTETNDLRIPEVSIKHSPSDYLENNFNVKDKLDNDDLNPNGIL